MAITVDFCFVFVSKQGRSNRKRPYPAARHIRLHNDTNGMSRASESVLWTNQKTVWLNLSAVLLAMHPQQWGGMQAVMLTTALEVPLPQIFWQYLKTSSERELQASSSIKGLQNSFWKMEYRMGDDLRTTLCHASSAVIFSAYWKLEKHPKNCRLGNKALGALGRRGHEGSLQHSWLVVHMDQLHSSAWSRNRDVQTMSSLLIRDKFFPFILKKALPRNLISFPSEAILFPIIPLAVQAVIQVMGFDSKTTSSASHGKWICFPCSLWISSHAHQSAAFKWEQKIVAAVA